MRFDLVLGVDFGCCWFRVVVTLIVLFLISLHLYRCWVLCVFALEVVLGMIVLVWFGVCYLSGFALLFHVGWFGCEVRGCVFVMRLGLFVLYYVC